MKTLSVSTLVLLFPLLLLGRAACAGAQPTATVLAPGWTRLADMPEGLAKFGVAATLGDTLVVAGGYDTRNTSFLYDTAKDRWQPGPTLAKGSDNLALVSVTSSEARVYALGGEAGTAVQVYDMHSGRWSLGPSLPSVRFAAAAAVLGQHIHVATGWNANNRASASLDSQVVFDLATQTWQAGVAAPLKVARNAAASAVVGGRWYVMGGRAPGIRVGDQRSLANVEVYDPASNTWSDASALPTPRASAVAVALDGKIYLFGGETEPGTVSDQVACYDPATQRWTVLAPMPLHAHGMGAVVVRGAIYLMGGFTAASDAVASESRALYRFVPAGQK